MTDPAQKMERSKGTICVCGMAKIYHSHPSGDPLALRDGACLGYRNRFSQRVRPKWDVKNDDTEQADAYMDQLEREIADLKSKLTEAQEMDHRVREQLWITHGCDIRFLYGDDGEMQCNRLPFIDFKRDSFQLIMDGISLHNLLRMQEAELEKQKEPQL